MKKMKVKVISDRAGVVESRTNEWLEKHCQNISITDISQSQSTLIVKNSSSDKVVVTVTIWYTEES